MELLEVLKLCVGCDYISDLPLKRSLRPSIKATISVMDANAYPLKEWNNAVEYLTRTNYKASTCAEAKKAIIDRL